MDSRLLPAHLKRVQEEKYITQNPPTAQKSSTGDTHPGDFSGHLFGLTFTDDGPDTNSGASKLWNSRAEYQELSPSSDIIAGPLSPPPISDIVESLGRLSLNSPQPMTHPSGPPISQIAGCRIMRKDGYQRSLKALKLLSNIEARANRYRCLLLDPSDGLFDKVSGELPRLRTALENIKRKTDFIDTRKKEITITLETLEREVKAKRTSYPSTKDSGPIYVNTGKRVYIVQIFRH